MLFYKILSINLVQILKMSVKLRNHQSIILISEKDMITTNELDAINRTIPGRFDVIIRQELIEPPSRYRCWSLEIVILDTGIKQALFTHAGHKRIFKNFDNLLTLLESNCKNARKIIVHIANQELELDVRSYSTT